MKRRSFLGALAGLALAPFGVEAAAPKAVTYKGVPIKFELFDHQKEIVAEVRRRHRAALQDLSERFEESFWGT